jgi:hypothetical protein
MTVLIPCVDEYTACDTIMVNDFRISEFYMVAKKKPSTRTGVKYDRQGAPAKAPKPQPKSSSSTTPSSSNPRNLTPAQIAAATNSRGNATTFQPTSAFVKPGQKATGLAKATTDRRIFTAPKPSKTETGLLKALEVPGKVANFVVGGDNITKAIQKPSARNIVTAAVGLIPVPTIKGANAAYKGSYALGKTVVHGSPKTGLTSITPRLGSAARPTERVAYGWNPRAFGAGSRSGVGGYVSEYSGTGSAYIGKVKRKDIVPDTNPGIVVSKGPIRVKKEIRGLDPRTGRVDPFIGNKIDKALPGATRRQGIQKANDAYAARRRAAQLKKSSRNSVV